MFSSAESREQFSIAFRNKNPVQQVYFRYDTALVNPRKFVAIKGGFDVVRWLEPIGSRSSCAHAPSHLSISWIDGIYDKYLHFHDKAIATFCEEEITKQFDNLNWKIGCIRFSAKHFKSRKHYILLTKNADRLYWLDKGTPANEDLSWNESFKACQSIGGSLPQIQSREELEEVVALIKLNDRIPPMEAIYIGLKWSRSQVRRHHKESKTGVPVTPKWDMCMCQPQKLNNTICELFQSKSIFFQAKFLWINGAPLAFQAFHNFNFGHIKDLYYANCQREDCVFEDRTRSLETQVLYPDAYQNHFCTVLIFKKSR